MYTTTSAFILFILFVLFILSVLKEYEPFIVSDERHILISPDGSIKRINPTDKDEIFNQIVRNELMDDIYEVDCPYSNLYNHTDKYGNTYRIRYHCFRHKDDLIH